MDVTREKGGRRKGREKGCKKKRQQEKEQNGNEDKKDRILSFIYPYRKHLISCILETATLDDAPKYIAISYAWGIPSLVRQLMIVRSESGRVNLELKL